jgi:hypothetical protein
MAETASRTQPSGAIPHPAAPLYILSVNPYLGHEDICGAGGMFHYWSYLGFDRISPFPWREGLGGGGVGFGTGRNHRSPFTPTLTLPHQGGGKNQSDKLS